MERCKRHRWRVGAGEKCVLLPEGILSLNVHLWCERCDATMTAYNYSKHEEANLLARGAKFLREKKNGNAK